MKKEVNVVSNGQEGGFTIGEVNADFKFSRVKKIKISIAATLAISISVFIGKNVINFYNSINMDTHTYNVTSNNQQGGITAGQINIGAPQRRINDKLKLALEDYKDKKIMISVPIHDQEATQFGYEIQDFLRKGDYNYMYLVQMVFSEPQYGIKIQEEDGFINLVIGSQMNEKIS